ncbi:MAG: hypothetical protein ACI9U0_000145 [Flavobacteriales bacterium]|jgi:hypothetical protein|tara:strand:+ start:2959 stop:3357 length:399 start_codon:yes stop_codon:yes gene_type:complete
MIYISTEKIILKSSSKELFNFLSDPNKMAEIISYKKTRHLKVEGDLITFIIKWAARFNFVISKITEDYLLIESTKDVEFSTAIRFDVSDENEGSSIILHAETDTSPVVDFTLEKKMNTWIKAISSNLETKFN